MKKLLFLIIISGFLSSCATILNQKTYRLKITSDKPNARVAIADTVYQLPEKINVTRSHEDLELTLITDSLEIDYTVKPSLSPTFLYGNLMGIVIAPVTYSIDLTNNKRFYYRRSIHLNSRDTSTVIDWSYGKPWSSNKNYFRDELPRRKHDVNILLSIPYINEFYFQPENAGIRRNIGFWGISAGMEYFYNPNKYLGLRILGAIDSEYPVPANVSPGEVRESLGTSSIEVTDNCKFNRWHLGYGVNFSNNSWIFIDESTADTIEIRRRNQSIGLTANAYLQVFGPLSLGIIYRPTFYRITPTPEFRYEHLISVDFALKLAANNESAWKFP